MDRSSFFHTLYQFCEGKIELRVFGKDRAFIDQSELLTIDAFCLKNQKENIYFGVGTRDGMGGEKANVVDIPAVWCDVDYKGTPRELIAKKLKEFPFKPSIIIRSGGGIHIYWLLKEPASNGDMSVVEDINHRIADKLGGDHNSCDGARVLRVPDTFNCKYDPPMHCEVATYDQFYYALPVFLEILFVTGRDNHRSRHTTPHLNQQSP